MPTKNSPSVVSRGATSTLPRGAIDGSDYSVTPPESVGPTAVSDVDGLPELTPWSRQVLNGLRRIASGAPVPRFGGPVWRALPNNAPTKLAAVVVAAEAWRDHCSTASVSAELHHQLDEVDRESQRRIREASYAVSAATDWNALAASPNHVELSRARRGAA